MTAARAPEREERPILCVEGGTPVGGTALLRLARSDSARFRHRDCCMSSGGGVVGASAETLPFIGALSGLTARVGAAVIAAPGGVARGVGGAVIGSAQAGWSS
jgi:hypothetical protein